MLSETEWGVVTQFQVAAILGISPQAVRQAERRALNKLRIALLPILRFESPELAAETAGRALLQHRQGPRTAPEAMLTHQQLKRREYNARAYQRRKDRR